MSLPDETSVMCGKCDSYNFSPVICPDCIEKEKEKRVEELKMILYEHITNFKIYDEIDKIFGEKLTK